jgi:hypothetical protein
MKILDRQPIPKEHTSLRFGGRFITLRPNQILVWMSVHLSGVAVPRTAPSVTPRALAISASDWPFGFKVLSATRSSGLSLTGMVGPSRPWPGCRVRLNNPEPSVPDTRS